ncbi:hypothetical protein REPUB_Repub16aG0062200 [Reevesia pubescens]
MGSEIKKEIISSGKLPSSGRRKRIKTKTTSSTVRSKTEATSNPSVVEKYKLSYELEWVDEIPECPVFRPSMEDFQNPLSYLQTIAQQASKYGICKIVSPWKASVPASDVLMKEQRGFQFKAYIQHLRLHEWNVNDKATFLMRESTYNYRSFEKMANKAFAKRFPQYTNLFDPVFLEKEFWREMARGIGTVEYGVNIDGSAFSSDPNDQLGQSNGNLKTLPQLPNCTLRLLEYQIPGITFPMLYIGMLFSAFAWHAEDHYLYSINYHHSGAPKTWYGVPGHAAPLFDKVAQDYVYSPDILSPIGEDGASALLAEKTTMFPPNILLQHNVPVYKAVQMPGEYVVTFPRAYHAGFSQGFNCGEAVNFGIGEWFPWGAVAGQVYAHLCKMVILPYEELLCKEAIILSKSSNYPSSDQLASQTCVKSSFIHHIESIKNALWDLNNLKALFNYSPKSQGTIVCQLCKRDCYLAFLGCDSCSHHTCLFHDFNSLNCSSCLGKLIVFLREDIWDVVDAYEKFEGRSEQELLNICSCIEHGLARSPKEENERQESVNSTEGAVREKNKLGKNNYKRGYYHETTLSSFPKDCKRPRKNRKLHQHWNHNLDWVCSSTAS